MLGFTKISVRNADYNSVLKMQRDAFELRLKYRKEGKELPADIIYFVEHTPVITLGKHGDKENLLYNQTDLSKLGVEYHEIDRGGDITYHGPGQLTVYLVVDMLRRRLGVKEFVRLLEEAVIRTIAEYKILGERVEGKTGVWVKSGATERKICAIGIKCSRFVSMHGLALNINTDLKGFDLINPCGLGKPVTSLELETGNTISLKEAEGKLYAWLKRLL